MPRTLHLSKLLIVNELFYIEDSAMLVEDSRIVSIGNKSDFGDLKNYNVIDHGNSLICSGFINLHTHLLYSGFGRIEGSDGLFPWLEILVDRFKETTDEAFRESVRFGIDQVISTGTTYVVENTPSMISVEELSQSPLKSLIGIEVFGSDEEKAVGDFDGSTELAEVRLSHQVLKSSMPEITLSPHAGYDVSAPLWKMLVSWANENNKFLLTHLEESPEERLWWQEKKGNALNFWKKINTLEPKLKYWKPYRSGVDFLDQNKILSKNIIATHLSQAFRKDVIALKEHNVSLVHCPRSNYYLSNGLANLALWDEIGVLWGLGTDSMASNDNLDLLEESRFAISHQNLYNGYIISSASIFSAITSRPAKILRKENELGSLKEGFYADFLVYKINDEKYFSCKDPYDFLIWKVKNNEDLINVFINGEEIFKNKRQE